MLKPQEKLGLMGDAYIKKRLDDGREILTINDALPGEMYEAIKDIQFELNENTHNFEEDYKLMGAACLAMSDNATDLESLQDIDQYEIADGAASVYTADQLAYITIWNQDEIAEHVRGLGIDIGTAAAYWYEQQVAQCIDRVRDYILRDDNDDE